MLTITVINLILLILTTIVLFVCLIYTLKTPSQREPIKVFFFLSVTTYFAIQIRLFDPKLSINSEKVNSIYIILILYVISYFATARKLQRKIYDTLSRLITTPTSLITFESLQNLPLGEPQIINNGVTLTKYSESKGVIVYNVEYEPGVSYFYYKNDFYKRVQVLSGAILYTVRGVKTLLRTGDTLTVDPFEIHMMKSSEGGCIVKTVIYKQQEIQ